MNIKKLEESIKYYNISIRRIKKMKSLTKELIESDIDYTKINNIIFYDDRIAFEPNSLKQLHYIRKFLRFFLGSWKDKLTGIDCPCDYRTSLEKLKERNRGVLIRYVNNDNEKDKSDYSNCIVIWLKVGINDIPKQYLKNDNCGFVDNNEMSTGNGVSFVCKIKDKEVV